MINMADGFQPGILFFRSIAIFHGKTFSFELARLLDFEYTTDR